MSGFRAFKAQVPIQWSESLYITLVRGLPGTRKLHRRTLEAMGLRRCHRTVLHSNTSSTRGMIQQVKRMVVVEPEEMFKARKEASQPQSSPPSVCCQSFNPCNRLIQHVLSISEDANKKCWYQWVWCLYIFVYAGYLCMFALILSYPKDFKLENTIGDTILIKILNYSN